MVIENLFGIGLLVVVIWAGRSAVLGFRAVREALSDDDWVGSLGVAALGMKACNILIVIWLMAVIAVTEFWPDVADSAWFGVASTVSILVIFSGETVFWTRFHKMLKTPPEKAFLLRRGLGVLLGMLLVAFAGLYVLSLLQTKPPPFSYSASDSYLKVCRGDDMLAVPIHGASEPRNYPAVTAIIGGIYSPQRIHTYPTIFDVSIAERDERLEFDFHLPRELPELEIGLYEYRHAAISIWELGLSRPAGFSIPFSVVDCVSGG